MIFVGTSGYSYLDWQGRFYPNDLSQSDWLAYYCRYFQTVESNLTFFKLPASPVFRHWRGRTPKDFRFMLKGPREITHRKRLKDCHEELAEFFERASELKEKLAGVLWQVPPRFSHDRELLRDFLAELTRAQIVFGKIRQAFEFHDPSWFEEPIYAVLRDFQAALVVGDRPFDIRLESQGISRATNQEKAKAPTLLQTTDHDQRTHHRLHHHFVVPQTADFVYVRRHGPAGAEPSSYSDSQLDDLAAQLQRFPRQSDVYVFFNNARNAYAITDAQYLQRIVAK